MIPAWIIEEIKEKEKEKQNNKKSHDRPRIEKPVRQDNNNK